MLNQAIRDAKSVYKKSKKQKKRPILKKPVYFINNQNYSVGADTIAFPILVGGKTKKTTYPAIITDRDQEFFQQAKYGLMRIVEKAGKWYAQISLKVPTPESKSTGMMGVDMGLKIPAVAVTDNGKTRFFGNGRLNKFVRRKFKAKRKQLAKGKKIQAIRNMDHKEQRWMKDQDHKISRQNAHAFEEGRLKLDLEYIDL